MWDERKNPEADIGYTESAVKGRGYRLDEFYRWARDVNDQLVFIVEPEF